VIEIISDGKVEKLWEFCNDPRDKGPGPAPLGGARV
jgi:hypothetical protein